jgi:MFS family permease
MPGAKSSPAYPPAKAAWYVAGVLFLATACSYLDTQVLSLLIQPIQRDLHLSDSAFSALYGFAFTALMGTLGVPIGRLVDNYPRRPILAGGVLIWSLMTMACGLAHGFWQLFAWRALAGIGVACLSPLCLSLLGDCFEPRMRSRALSVFLLGVFAGQGLSMAIGGGIFQWVSQGAPLPLIGDLAPWRQVFLVVGAPGLVMALVAFTMIEPRRHDLTGAAPGGSGGPTLLGYMLANKTALGVVFIGEALLAMVGYSVVAWTPAYLIRAFGMPEGSVGGYVGLLFGSIVCDRWTSRGVKAAKFRVNALGMAAAALPIALLPVAPSAAAALACIGACLVAMPFASAASRAMLQELFPNQFRGQGSAIALLLQSLVGVGGGPLAVGLASDYLFTGSRSLGFSVALVCLLAIGTYNLLYLRYRDAYEATRARLLASENL